MVGLLPSLSLSLFSSPRVHTCVSVHSLYRPVVGSSNGEHLRIQCPRENAACIRICSWRNAFCAAVVTVALAREQPRLFLSLPLFFVCLFLSLSLALFRATVTANEPWTRVYRIERWRVQSGTYVGTVRIEISIFECPVWQGRRSTNYVDDWKKLKILKNQIETEQSLESILLQWIFHRARLTVIMLK